MKRLIPILLTCALALGLAGCGDFAPDPTQTPDAAADYSFDRTNFPALAGGSAQEPLAEAIAAIMLGETREGVADLLSFGNTQEAWDRPRSRTSCPRMWRRRSSPGTPWCSTSVRAALWTA